MTLDQLYKRLAEVLGPQWLEYRGPYEDLDGELCIGLGLRWHGVKPGQKPNGDTEVVPFFPDAD